MSLFSKNQISIIGRVGNAEVKTTTSGMDILSFSVATTESWKDKETGEYTDQTTWHNVVMFKPNDYLKKQIQKGKLISVDGKLTKRKWEQDGKSGLAVEIYPFFDGVTLIDIEKNGDSPETYNHFPDEKADPQPHTEVF